MYSIKIYNIINVFSNLGLHAVRHRPDCQSTFIIYCLYAPATKALLIQWSSGVTLHVGAPPHRQRPPPPRRFWRPFSTYRHTVVSGVRKATKTPHDTITCKI